MPEKVEFFCQKQDAFGDFKQRICGQYGMIGTIIVIFLPSQKIQKILLKLENFRVIIYKIMQLY